MRIMERDKVRARKGGDLRRRTGLRLQGRLPQKLSNRQDIVMTVVDALDKRGSCRISQRFLYKVRILLGESAGADKDSSPALPALSDLARVGRER